MNLFHLSQSATIDLANQYGFGNVNSVSEVVGKLYPAALSVAGAIITFYFIFGAYKFLTSQGDKNAVGEARDMIMHGLIALVMLILVFAFIKFIFGAFNVNVSITASLETFSKALG